MKPTKGRILIVEDHLDTCELMITFLEQSSYEVWPACTVADGARLARSQRFDLYLLDNRLPDGTGVELCRQIRQLHPRTPILFFSALVSEGERQRALRAGAQSFVKKPSDLTDLGLTISRLLDDRNARAAA